MKIIPTLIALTALPFMALGQTADQQQDAAKEQTKESQEKTPAKKKKAHAAHPGGQSGDRREHARRDQSQGSGEGHEEVRSQGAFKQDPNEGEQVCSSSRTTAKCFHLVSIPKSLVQRYGANHFRLIGNSDFVFVDGCWVAVDVAGFVFVERVICQGDPDFIVVY